MSSRQLKIMVIGATGYIGSTLCATLCAQGYAVYAAALPGGDYSHINNYIVKYSGIDLTNPAECQKLTAFISQEKIGSIIFATGMVNYEQGYEAGRTANVTTVENFFAALHNERPSSIKKILFIGSIASHGFLTSKPVPGDYLREDHSHYQQGVSVYCDVKYEATAIVKKYIAKGLKAIILEPGSLVGKGLGATHTTNDSLIKMIRKGFPVLSGGASYVSLQKLATGMVLALEKGTIGESYVLGGENLTMKEFALLVRTIYTEKVCSRRLTLMPVLTLPKVMARLLASCGLGLNKQQALLGTSYHYIDSSKANKELGYEHGHDDLICAIAEVIINQ